MGKTTAFAFPLHVGDWLKGTARLRPEARGFYLDLLLYQWDADAPIPEDEVEQMQIARCTDRRQWRDAWARLREKFEPVEGGYRNRRVEEERAKLQKTREQRAEAGAKGNRQRWGNRRGTPRESVAGAIAEHVAGESRERRIPSSDLLSDLDLKTNPDHTPLPPEGADDGFDAFWQAYPRKVAKVSAERAWRKLRPSADTAVLIVHALRQHCRQPQWQRDGGAYIPHAATWLNQHRWNDDIDAGERPPTSGLASSPNGMSWWHDCKRDHDGACPNRNQHDLRVFREAQQETPLDEKLATAR